MPLKRIGTFFLASACWVLASGVAVKQASAETVRFLVPRPWSAWSGAGGDSPSSAFSSAERAMTEIVEQYNLVHPQARVELIRRGENFSSLKDLIASQLAGEPIDLAVIESSEIPAISKTRLARTIPAAKVQAILKKMNPAALRQSRDSDGKLISLPFERVLATLVLNRTFFKEIPKNGIKDWNGLPEQRPSVTQSLAIPLVGPRGLFFLEALSGKPLWKRQAGGIQANRELIPTIQELQRLESRQLIRSDETLERAVQAFLGQKAASLVITTDLLPYLAAQASFPWSAHPVGSPVATGSQLVLLRESPAIWNFLNYLYSPPIASRWVAAGGSIPVRSDGSSLGLGLGRLGLGSGSPVPPSLLQLPISKVRTSDPEVVRLRSGWIQALPLLFGDPTKRKGVEEVLNQLDLSLTGR